MKITLLQENLLKHLKVVQRAVARKPQLPILGAILLSVDESNRLHLTATDLFLGVESMVQGDSGEVGKWAAPGKQLSDIVQALPPGKLTLEVIDNQLRVSSQRSKSHITLMDPEEFPTFPELNADPVSLSLSEVESILSTVGFATSSDETRPVLTSIYFKPSDDSSVEVVATDGFRLSKRSFPVAFSADELLLPAKALKEVTQVAKQLGADEITVVVDNAQKQVSVSFEGTTLYLRMIDGQFPPYQDIIPAGFSITGFVDAEELQQALKACQVFARDTSNVVTLTLDPSEIRVSAASPTYGNHESSLPWETDSSETGTIAFNITYILDMLQSLKPSRLWIAMNDSLQPAMIKPDKESDQIYLVMPFKLNQ